MYILMLCLCYIGYILWSKVLKVPEDAPPRMSHLSNIKLLLANTDLWTKYTQIADITQDLGGVIVCTVGLHTMYGITNPEDSLTVLKACAEKGFAYDVWKPFLGNNSIFTGPASTNKIHRKTFLPMVSPKKLESFIQAFDQHAKRFVPKMATYVGKPPFNIIRHLLIFNVELLCTTLLGLPDMDKTYDFNPYCDSLASFLRSAIDRFQNILYYNETIYSLSKLKRKQDKEVDIIHHLSTDLIEKRKQLIHKEQREGQSADKQANNESFIDVLAESVSKGIITETEMREEIDTIIFGGHDTTGFTMMYTMILLGSHPEIQEKLFEEMQDILGKSKDVSITKEDLSRMIYLEACIKESMRLLPFAAIFARRLDKDVKLRTCTLREGGTAWVFVCGVHRDPSWGPDALQYRPERWLEPDKLPRPTALLGFSEGPRVCVGRRYVMLSMKVLFAHLVREYRFKADHTQLQFEMLGAMEPKSGHHIALEKRA